MARGGMRDKMPVVAAWIDDLRKGFGAEYIDSIIKAAVHGAPVFFASENGHTVGTPVPVGIRVGKDERGNACLLDGPLEAPEPVVSKYEARRRRELRGVKW